MRPSCMNCARMAARVAELERQIADDTFCAYCGYKYPKGTPSHRNELLTEHIKVCEQHPMRAAERRIKELEDHLLEVRRRLAFIEPGAGCV